MTGVRFKSDYVGHEEVGDFPILGKGFGAHPKLTILQCPTLPDLLINSCDTTFLIMCLLMLKDVISANILYIAIPFGLTMLGDTLMATMSYNFFYERRDESDAVKDWRTIGWCPCITHTVLHSLRIYLICKYIYVLKMVLSTTNSLRILAHPENGFEMEVKLPSYFQTIDATFILLLILFGSLNSFLPLRHMTGLQREVTGFAMIAASAVDSTAWYIYMFICRWKQPTNEIAYFSILISKLPFLYFALSIVRVCFSGVYKANVQFANDALAPWKMNARRIRFLLDFIGFFASYVFVIIYSLYSTIDCFYYFIYLAITERIVLSLLNVHLLWYYDANDDPDPFDADKGPKYPHSRQPPVAEPPRQAASRDSPHHFDGERPHSAADHPVPVMRSSPGIPQNQVLNLNPPGYFYPNHRNVSPIRPMSRRDSFAVRDGNQSSPEVAPPYEPLLEPVPAPRSLSRIIRNDFPEPARMPLLVDRQRRHSSGLVSPAPPAAVDGKIAIPPPVYEDHPIVGPPPEYQSTSEDLQKTIHRVKELRDMQVAQIEDEAEAALKKLEDRLFSPVDIPLWEPYDLDGFKMDGPIAQRAKVELNHDESAGD